MLFTSAAFLLFAALTLALYYLIPKRGQWILLLLAGLVFYAFAGWDCMIFLLSTATVTYLTAAAMQRMEDAEDAYVEAHRAEMGKTERKAYRAAAKKRRTRVLLIGLLLGFGTLAVLKYTGFVLTTVREIVTAFGGTKFRVPSLLLPLGISFYTFQSMGYLIDVWRKKVRAERNPAKFLLFVSFFPQMLQGPISRFGDLEEQLCAPHAFDGAAFRAGFLRAVWGYFKKIVVADTVLSAVVELSSRQGEYTGVYAVLLILLYTAEIYGDFTGGIDITIGISEMMGIRLKENFNRPFSSTSVREYWNRWHITMGTWFTDYVFYPLSVTGWMQNLSAFCSRHFGNGFGMRVPVYLATIVTWFLTGLWHGAGWNFIVWGLLNCFLILLSRELNPLWNAFHRAFPKLSASGAWRLWQAARTFLLMGLIRSLDCYGDVPLAFSRWGSILTTANWGEIFRGGLTSFGMSPSAWGVLALGVLAMLAVSRLGREKPLRYTLAERPILLTVCLSALVTAILLFGAYGIEYDATRFIYTQF